MLRGGLLITDTMRVADHPSDVVGLGTPPPGSSSDLDFTDLSGTFVGK
jgi:hypothetical protein